MSDLSKSDSALEIAKFIRGKIPQEGLFESLSWRLSPQPFKLGEELTRKLESLGRIFLQFNRAVNLLYRQSVMGKQPAWVAQLLDQGKPAQLIETQRATAFKNSFPRVIRPDLLLADTGLAVSELDSVPGGIGLTAWFNKTYSSIPGSEELIVGGADGMFKGFEGLFNGAARVHIIVSEEARTYQPEMEWLCKQLGERFQVRNTTFDQFGEGDAVYRFFELFDLANVPNASKIFQLALEKRIQLTPPPKPLFEEKLLLALLWNRNLHEFWRRELGERFFARMLEIVPRSWVVDPTPMPPHAAIPELNLTDWNQLKNFSQRDRQLILKISGFSEKAWGARGVFLGSDLSTADWSVAVDEAIRSFPESPYILQRYCKPKLVDAAWYDFDANNLVSMSARVRLCPYYFVHGEGDAARTVLGGVLATLCPADKKIIHGMTTAILTPCAM